MKFCEIFAEWLERNKHRFTYTPVKVKNCYYKFIGVSPLIVLCCNESIKEISIAVESDDPNDSCQIYDFLIDEYEDETTTQEETFENILRFCNEKFTSEHFLWLNDLGIGRAAYIDKKPPKQLVVKPKSVTSTIRKLQVAIDKSVLDSIEGESIDIFLDSYSLLLPSKDGYDI